MKNKLYVMIVALLCTSCVTPFDLRFDDEPVIYLEAFPGVEDKVVFTIGPAYSYSNSAKRPDFEPVITFKVNGREMPVVLNTGHCVDEDYPEECYVSDYKPVPGDEMSVEVRAPGFISINAETSIPMPFPERKIDYRKVTVGDRDYNVVYVSFDDDADTEIAYGLQIYNETIYRISNGEEEVFYYPYSGFQIAEDYDFAPVSLEGFSLTFNGWITGTGGGIAGWDDDSFNGRRMTISTSVQTVGYGDMDTYDNFFEYPIEGEWYDDSGNLVGTYTGLTHNKLVFYTMSQEFYKYALAQELKDSNSSLFAGLAPSNYCYSNVKNGYGAFAGVYRVETDWITKEFIEANR